MHAAGLRCPAATLTAARCTCAGRRRTAARGRAARGTCAGRASCSCRLYGWLRGRQGACLVGRRLQRKVR